MTKKGTDIVAYITIVGWVLAFACGTRTESGFHLNQALVLFLANVVWESWLRFWPLSQS